MPQALGPWLVALAVSAPLHAATVVRTVGPGGDYASFADAVDAATIAAQSHPETAQEVRVAAGDFVASTTFVPAGTVLVSGGWSADFSTAGAGVTTLTRDPAVPTLNADSGPAASLTLRRLRILGGSGQSAYASTKGRLVIEDCLFEDSTPQAGQSVIDLRCSGCQQLRFANNVVRNHHLTGSAGLVNASLLATAFGGHLELADNQVTGNQLAPGSSTYAVGHLLVNALQGAVVQVTGNVVRDNAISTTIGRPAGASVSADGASTTLLFERNSVASNASTDALADQVALSASQGATITARSNLIFDAPRGLYLHNSAAAGAVHNSNWTIDTSQVGVYCLYNAGQMTFDSSIVRAPQPFFGDTAHISTTASQLGNDGADPFVDRAAGDYHLATVSTAREAGTNTPASGLGATDLDGNARLQGRTVDQGAYEATPCVADDSTLCLGERFAVAVDWQLPTAQTGHGHAVALTADTGYFWFFNAANVELVVKVLNACGLNQRYWVFAGGLTNVATTITVTDRFTGLSASYDNPQGSAFRPVQDTDALASCP